MITLAESYTAHFKWYIDYIKAVEHLMLQDNIGNKNLN